MHVTCHSWHLKVAHFFYTFPSPLTLLQIDKDGANPERVMQELSSIGLMPEDWGGDIPMVQVCELQHVIYSELSGDATSYLLMLIFFFFLGAHFNRSVLLKGKMWMTYWKLACLLQRLVTFSQAVLDSIFT